MQPVNLISEVENSLGALGYSVLQNGYDGKTVNRMTILMLRDSNGWAKACVIAPAETLLEVIF